MKSSKESSWPCVFVQFKRVLYRWFWKGICHHKRNHKKCEILVLVSNLLNILLLCARLVSFLLHWVCLTNLGLVDIPKSFVEANETTMVGYPKWIMKQFKALELFCFINSPCEFSRILERGLSIFYQTNKFLFRGTILNSKR